MEENERVKQMWKNMTFNEVYEINYAWRRSTTLTIFVNDFEIMKAGEARRKYGDYTVELFVENRVGLSRPEDEAIVTLKEFKRNLDTQIMQVQLDANSMYGLSSRPVNTYGKLVKLETLLEVREALKEVEG